MHPKTTAFTTPNNLDVSPLSKAPNSFEEPTKIEFTDDYKYSEEEILEEFKNANFEIELSIS